jgi:asparagine synthase (glutamine-hydrolysing)
MCGIAGILTLRDDAAPPAREELARMIGAIAHRGPDELGAYLDARAGLAHARLSIVDLATGQQPLCNEDGSLWTVYNGEVFNYVELRAELAALGHAFRTASDTEVVVHAYEQWGEDAFARFNGQFALALWDARRRTLVLARDRLGVRPLHWCEHRGRLYFASEVKALFAADPAIPRALDPAGVDQTFTFWAPVAPRTAFAGVHELEPGHVRTVTRGRAHDAAFWRPRYPEDGRGGFRGSLDDAVGAVREALERATSLRLLRADVPVGCYLSGGLDSSLVAALARRAKGDRFVTFSVRFEEAEFDETRFQRAMAAHLGSEHRELVVSRRDVADAFADVVLHAERPILRTAPAPLYLLSGLVRRAGIKAVLTGEGADEMFAGYDLFREAKVRRAWARHPESALRPRLLERLYPYLARSPVAQRAIAARFFGRDLARAGAPGFGHGIRWSVTASLKRLFSPALRDALAGRDAAAELLASLPPEITRWAPLAQDQYLEVRTLLAGYILSSQGDRMLMAHSVEGRFPFLDPDVVALANSLPPGFKLHVLDEKHVLKRAAADLVPRAVLERTKQPYRAPDARALLDGRTEGAACLEPSRVADAGVFDPAAVALLARKCAARPAEEGLSNSDAMALVGVLSTQLLHERLVRRAPDPRPVTFDWVVRPEGGST